jgi:hypothetical protein
MLYHADAGHAPGSPTGIVTDLRTVDIRGAVLSALDRAAFAVATAAGSRDAGNDKEGAEPLLADASRTGVSIAILAVRILGASQLRCARLCRGGLAAAV